MPEEFDPVFEFEEEPLVLVAFSVQFASCCGAGESPEWLTTGVEFEGESLVFAALSVQLESRWATTCPSEG